MAKYIKLDWDWADDPKVMEFRELNGKAALFDLVQFYIALSKVGGVFDFNDRQSVLVMQSTLGKRGKALMTFINKVAACGLIDKDAWEQLKRAGSDRSIKDAEAMEKRRDYAAEASKAAAEARRKRSKITP